MSENHNVIVATFGDNSSAAFEAHSAVADLPGVRFASVLSRDSDGRISLPEVARAGDSKALTGGLVGGLIGVLGGPLGMLLGWSTGALVGAASDAGDADDAVDGVALISNSIEPGTNALVVEAVEPDPAVLDTVLARVGGTALRIPADEVQAEVEAARDQTDQAAKAARKLRRETRRDAFHDRVSDWFHRDAE